MLLMLESETRRIIDSKLKKVGWDTDNHNKVVEEFLIEKSIEKESKKLFADYALLDTDGSVIAIIEAKKFSRSAKDGKHQAIEYAELISQKQGYYPFIFLSNGLEIFYLNLENPSPPRKVKTFFSIEDLKRIRELQKIKTPISEQQVNTNIAGRVYQIEAIKKVCEGIDSGKREFLLVMATGTGKTRTAMGLISNLFNSHCGQRVLFLCDRTALRDQSFDDGYKVFFENEPKTKIETGKTDDNARLYSATYQTMINYLDSYSSGYFDLIIIDEVHRSLYGEWTNILEHFDAIRVGLTATPVQFVDRNTYKVFGCEESSPTYYYGLDDGIKDGYLVPYKVLMARTKFQIQGIKGRQLPAEIREQLIKEGKDPEEYNFEGSEIGKQIDNKDTNRAVVREFMEQSIKIEDGLPGKSIIFAMDQKHAEHLQEAFEEMYPHLVDFSVVITSNVERADELLKDFKKLKKEKKFRVAISVDMLDTGVDVPEVINLVFAKKVWSEAKFWQMVGRGTRLCPNLFGPGEDKTEFLIIDFAMNFDESHEFKDMPARQLSLQQKLFEEYIEQVTLFDNRSDTKNLEKTKKKILSMIQSIPTNDEILAKQQLINDILEGKIWDNIAVNPKEALQRIAPLMRYSESHTVDELRFLLKTEKLASALIQDEDSKGLQNSLASDINSLSRNIGEVQDKGELITDVLNPRFWIELDLKKIELLQKEFTGLMKYKSPVIKNIIVTDLEDQVVERKWIEYGQGKQMKSDEYWAKFVESLEEYAKSSPAIQKILRDEQVSQADLQQLESIFRNLEFSFTTSTLNSVWNSITTDFIDLIKVALGKANIPQWELQVNKLFETFIQSNNFNSTQLRFLQIVKSFIIHKKIVTLPDDFYSPVFENQFGIGAFNRLFKQDEVEKIEKFVEIFRM